MPPDKYEDEIREILNRMDNFVPDGNEGPRPLRKQQPLPWSGWSSQFRRKVYTLNSTSVLASMVGLALVAAIMMRIYPPFAAIAATLSLACLVLAIALPMVSRRYGMPEKRWRGKVIDYEPYRIKRSGGSSWQMLLWQLKRFFRIR